MTTLVQLEPFVTECTERMVQKFEEFALSGNHINMQEWAQYWAFDVIGVVTVRYLVPFPSRSFGS